MNAPDTIRAAAADPEAEWSERVTRFLDAWPLSGTYPDEITALWVNSEPERRRLLKSDLLRLLGERDRLREAADAALRWLREECRPDAEWAAEGHNFVMSRADRERGNGVIASLRAALSAATGHGDPAREDGE